MSHDGDQNFIDQSGDGTVVPRPSDPGQSVIGHLKDLLGFEPRVQLRALTTESAYSVTEAKEEGKYVIEREIGQGGMGRVFLAIDRDLQRRVAVKVIQERYARNRELLARFVEEAQITGQLEHPGIPPVHELAINQNGEVFFTLKLLKGRTLKEIIRELHIGRREVRRRFSRTKLLQFMLSVANALHFAHDKGVIHRDVKPDNIMIGDYDEVQLMDWGLAKVVTRTYDEYESDFSEPIETVRTEQNLETLSEHIQGTLLYMAPEQAQGRGVDRRADVYALGATLYEILTFLPPRIGSGTTELLEEARLGLLTPPSQRAPRLRIPQELENICMRALEYHPDDRYETAQDMADAIQIYLDGTFEEERRRAESEHLLKEALVVARKHENAKAQFKRLHKERDEFERSVGEYPSRDDKRQLRDFNARIESTEIEIANHFTQAQRLLTTALTSNQDNSEARRLLGDLYLEKLHAAESEGRTTDSVYYLGLMTQIDDGRFQRIVKGHGALRLGTDPDGANIEVFRLEDEDGILTPRRKIASSRGHIELNELEMGSYTVRIELEGFAKTTYPVSIGRNQEIATTVRLYPSDRLPEGFAYIPEGRFTRFGDPSVYYTFQHTTVVDVPGYAIGIFPVTCAEYLEFLNHLLESDPDQARARCPRQSEQAGFLWSVADGRYELPPAGRYRWSGRLPVFGVSFADALAYARFRSERDELPFDLPREDEWEKAAKGTDRRYFPWGNTFDSEFANTSFTRPGDTRVCEVDEYPQDCSPYGVRGIVGNVSDWCYFESAEHREMAGIRGGNWALSGDTCRIAIRRSTSRSYVSDRFGFRLKLRLED